MPRFSTLSTLPCILNNNHLAINISTVESLIPLSHLDGCVACLAPGNPYLSGQGVSLHRMPPKVVTSTYPAPLIMQETAEAFQNSVFDHPCKDFLSHPPCLIWIC